MRTWRKTNPITVFEVIVFGYMEHLYSGREIAKACKTDIRFMWLLNGEVAPSHATISRFQEEKLAGAIYITQIAERFGVTEELKSTDPMRWMQEMNNIKASAEEIVLREVVLV